MDTSLLSSTSELSDPPSSPLAPSPVHTATLSSSNPPSSPLSVLTRSPSVPPCVSPPYRSGRLPSPPSSTTCSGSASPMKQSEPVEAEIHVNPDGAPPRKRRRVERKPRTTQFLDLGVAASDPTAENEELLEQLRNALRKKKKIVVIAGAGISVSAGIPDFRSSSGLFATLPKEHGVKGSGKYLFDASVYKHDDTTTHFHTMVRDLSQLVKNAKPTPFHHLLASLSKEGRLLRLYTQNVDGLDTSMEPLGTSVPLESKGPWPKTIQLHGGLEKMVCSKCNEISQFNACLFDGPRPPLCKVCEEADNVRTSHAGKRSHGIGRLRPRMVLYNEYNPDEEAIANVVRADLRARPDAVIVVGTSMKIPGVRNMVKDMCRVTRDRRDGITAWINLDPEPSGSDLKNCWDLVIRGKCDDVASLVHLPRFDETIEPGAETIVDNAKFESKVRHVKLEVEIQTSPPRDSTSNKRKTPGSSPVDVKPPSLEQAQGIPTPSSSPRIPTAGSTKPAVKPRQTKLAFSSSTGKAASTSAAKATKKPAPRRSKPAKKPEAKPRATINSTFKATKSNVVAPSKISAKTDISNEPSGHDQARSLLLSDFSLRPRSNRPAPESHAPQKNTRQQTLRPDISIKRPVTPTKQLQRDASLTRPVTPTKRIQRDASLTRPVTPTKQTKRPLAFITVSPPSKPRGMGPLID